MATAQSGDERSHRLDPLARTAGQGHGPWSNACRAAATAPVHVHLVGLCDMRNDLLGIR